MYRRVIRFEHWLAILFVVVFCGVAQADWLEDFDGNTFDQSWTFGAFPYVPIPTDTFSAAIQDGAEDDDYLRLAESRAYDPPSGLGSAFAMGFCPEDFGDVRVGAEVNLTGDASRNYFGVAARADYFIDPDGSITNQAPGMVATGAYLLLVHWEHGPANMRIEMLKIHMNDDQIMEVFQPEVPVPGLDHARSHYVELDVVGSNPVYVTGSIYAHKGGPLLVRTPTMIDTNGNDEWERAGLNDAVYAAGKSGVFVINESATPVGYHATFDTVSSISTGPSAVCLNPADGSTGVDIDADVQWAEAAFATSRELWFGEAGRMEKVAPSPSGTSYDPGRLAPGRTYQWQVNQIGAGGLVEGYTYTFTTAGTDEGCLVVDDFEGYSDEAAIQAFWPDNIDGYTYAYLETGEVGSGSKALRYEIQNQYPPYVTMLTRTFTAEQDWSGGFSTLSLSFRGERSNVEQRLYVELVDAVGNSHAVANPYEHAIQSRSWNQWHADLAEFSAGGVDLGRIKKIIIGVGDGVDSGQSVGDEDVDRLYIDDIQVCPRRCEVNLRGDVNADCVVDLKDFAEMAADWLDNG